MGGGVLSVIRNLITFSGNTEIENHIIYTINVENKSLFKIEHIDGTSTETVFYYNRKWNFYYTCRKLLELLPADNNVLLVAHDWLELGMISNLGLQFPVVQFVHGDYEYYYNLAQLHKTSVDRFITVAKDIKTRLVQLIPDRVNDIAYLRFPVPSIDVSGVNSNESINIIFAGRLEDAKGYPLIPAIANELSNESRVFHWHIVGSGKNIVHNNAEWDENILVSFYGDIPNEQLLLLLKNMHIILLPSLAEGMPVVIIEAMKAGVIPIVNDIDGGLQELVLENQTGFKVSKNEVNGYVDKINLVANDRDKIKELHKNCVELANQLFDPFDNTRVIEDFLMQVATTKRKAKSSKKAYGSRLDEKWIPNWLTKIIRSF